MRLAVAAIVFVACSLSGVVGAVGAGVLLRTGTRNEIYPPLGFGERRR